MAHERRRLLPGALSFRRSGTRWTVLVATVIALAILALGLVSRLLSVAPSTVADLLPADATSAVVLSLSPDAVSPDVLSRDLPAPLRSGSPPSWDALCGMLVNGVLSQGTARYSAFPGAALPWDGAEVGAASLPGGRALAVWETTDAQQALAYMQLLKNGAAGAQRVTDHGVNITVLPGRTPLAYALIHATVYLGTSVSSVQQGIDVAQGRARSLLASLHHDEADVMTRDAPLRIYVGQAPLSPVGFPTRGSVALALTPTAGGVSGDGSTNTPTTALPDVTLPSAALRTLMAYLPSTTLAVRFVPGGSSANRLADVVVADTFLTDAVASLPASSATMSGETDAVNADTGFLVATGHEMAALERQWSSWVQASGGGAVSFRADGADEATAATPFEGVQPCVVQDKLATLFVMSCTTLELLRHPGPAAFPTIHLEGQATSVEEFHTAIVGEVIGVLFPGDVALFRSQLVGLTSVAIVTTSTKHDATFAFAAQSGKETVTVS